MDRRLLTLALGMFALGTDSFVFGGILPSIAQYFHVSIGAAGQLITVYALTFALLAPTIAALAAGIPRKHLLLGGMGLFIVANIGTILSPNLGIALATRALAGVGAAMFSPTASGTGTMLVPPERRGFALSVIVAGLTTATALGTPLGAVIGGLADWRWTLAFVAALGVAGFAGVWALLPEVPLPPAISLGKRFAPLADSRVGLILATTVLAQIGTFIIYNYFAVVFDRATGGNANVLGGLLVLWGLAGTFSNLVAGRALDKIGPRKVVIFMLIAVMTIIVTMPWTSTHLASAAIAVFVWGVCCWGVLVPQQYRLVSLNPSMAAVLVGLNTSATYVGVSIAGVVGAAAIPVIGSHNLGYLASALVVLALVFSEVANWRVSAAGHAKCAKAAATV
ncbi:major facilitator transporter [Caballeronia novacaledonica]|uniref:Major facilitator transporter n=1 Tax=Caballeronia novacaledonica TaxID=1544861 RepID=A0A2U3I169_9BURK|nr:MFS transporter [Caballeronia novacaledonica]SPB13826.1 major facilitator transporter [Caballeronia novacaledonica]